MIGRLLELFEGPEAPGPWAPPMMPAALHALLPWRAFDESAYEQALRNLDETLVLETMGKRFEEGPFRIEIGIVSTLAPYLLAGSLERLQDSEPRIELDVLETSGNELVAGLLANRLDAAILSLPSD